MLSIRNSLGRISAIGILAVTAAAGFVAPASAAVAPVAIHMGVAPKPVGPNTTISGSPAKWHPTALTGPPVPGTSCSATDYTFSITNSEKVSETILYKIGTMPKKVLGTVKPATKNAICGSGPKGAKAKFFIKGSKSVLTVTLS